MKNSTYWMHVRNEIFAQNVGYISKKQTKTQICLHLHKDGWPKSLVFILMGSTTYSSSSEENIVHHRAIFISQHFPAVTDRRKPRIRSRD